MVSRVCQAKRPDAQLVLHSVACLLFCRAGSAGGVEVGFLSGWILGRGGCMAQRELPRSRIELEGRTCPARAPGRCTNPSAKRGFTGHNECTRVQPSCWFYRDLGRLGAIL